MSAGELRDIARGGVVARTLDAGPDEVAICAATTLDVPAGFYVDQFRQIDAFKRGGPVQAVGRLAPDPSGAPLTRLTLDDGDLSALRDCRPGRCDLKLDREGLARLDAARGGSAPAMGPALGAHLADYASRYLREGDAALMAYADREPPTSVAAGMRAIVGDTDYLQAVAPALHDVLRSFTGTVPPGIESFVYWSKEAFGRKPVVSLTHALIAPGPDVTAIATKQIYASHYFDASLGVTLLGPPLSAGQGPRTTMIYLNRSKVDAFGGLLGRVARGVVRSRSRSGAERMIEALQARLRREYPRS